MQKWVDLRIQPMINANIAHANTAVAVFLCVNINSTSYSLLRNKQKRYRKITISGMYRKAIIRDILPFILYVF